MMGELAISEIPTQELKNEFAKSLGITAKYLVHLSEIWAELNRRNVDLSDLRHGLMMYLPLIAERKMEPQLVVSYAGQQTLLKALAKLPLEEQRSLSKSGYVTVATAGDDGRRVDVEIPLSQIKSKQIPQIFIDDGGIRSPKDQFILISNRTAKPKRLNQPVKNLVFDKENDGLLVDGRFISSTRLLEKLLDGYGPMALHDRVNAATHAGSAQ